MSRKALEATEPIEFWQGYTVDDLLSDIYELPQGIGTTIDGQRLDDWLGQGSRDEDNFADDFSLNNPLTWRFTGRFLNHFHDPMCAWDQAGLRQLPERRRAGACTGRLRPRLRLLRVPEPAGYV